MGVDNKLNALSLMDYGGTSDATVPGTGNNAQGTNNATALTNMLNAAADGQLCIIPEGNFRFSGGVTVTTKRVNVLILGTTYIDSGVTLFTINPPGSGSYRQHRIVHQGIAVGRVNMPSHTKANYDNGTGPVWTDFSTHLVKVVNVNQVLVETNRCEGFKSPVVLQAGGGLGGQENTITGRFWYKNAFGIYMVSTDGTSYMDKNVWTGPSDGTLRVSGGTAIMIDGYSGTAANGQIYNGAFRSNKICCMIEQVDNIAVCNGDITEPEFEVTVEGGVNTGVFSSDPWQMRVASPNNVRSPRYKMRGVLTPSRMGSGSTGSMGVNGTLDVAIWTDGSTAYLGNHADIDGAGNILLHASYAVSKTNRDAQPDYIKFVPGDDRRDRMDVTASGSQTPAYGVRWVYVTASGVTVNLPSPSTSVDRKITIFNDHASAAVTVGIIGTTLRAGSTTSIVAGKNATYFSDGSIWRDA